MFSYISLWQILFKEDGPFPSPEYATVRNCSNAIRISTDFECRQYYCSETMFGYYYYQTQVW